jgi:Protein of unknown function (DUF3435)
MLAVRHGLSFQARDKPVVDVDDVWAVLECHWVYDTFVYVDERQRIQIDLLILITAGTASRPSALVYNPSNEKLGTAARQLLGATAELNESKWNGLPYGAVRLFLVHAPHSPRGCLFFMLINLDHLKGHNSTTNPNK